MENDILSDSDNENDSRILYQIGGSVEDDILESHNHNPAKNINESIVDATMLNSFMKLREEQKELISTLPPSINNYRGCMFIAPPSFGKTYMILAISEYSRMHNLVPIILCPGMIHGQIKELFNTNSEQVPVMINSSSNTCADTLNSFLNNFGKCAVIVDEIHTLISKDMSKSIRPILTLLRNSQNIMLLFGLTATPIRYHMCDVNIAMLFWPYSKMIFNMKNLPTNKSDFDRMYKRGIIYDTAKIIKTIGSVLYVAPSIISSIKETIPVVNEPYIHPVPMGTQEIIEYQTLVNTKMGTFAFQARTRSIMETSKDKLRMIAEIAKSNKHPIVVYSNYINVVARSVKGMDEFNGLNPLFISANQSHTIRQNILKSFNTPKQEMKSKILFIGPSMTQGIEITCSNHLVYICPPTNLSDYIQIKGRLARTDTLSELDQKDRIIFVTVLCLYIPDQVPNDDLEDGGIIMTDDEKNIEAMNKFGELDEIQQMLFKDLINMQYDKNNIIAGGNDQMYLFSGIASLEVPEENGCCDSCREDGCDD